VRPESVGEHSYGTAILALLISKALIVEGKAVDVGKVTSLALIHDIPESLTSDIPQTEFQIGGETLTEGKRQAEKDAMRMISRISPDFKDWLESLWREHEDQPSLESRVVSSADLLDMLIHALTL
jgi:putative hydrolase of HD superfamily